MTFHATQFILYLEMQHMIKGYVLLGATALYLRVYRPSCYGYVKSVLSIYAMVVLNKKGPSNDLVVPTCIHYSNTF